MHAVAVDADDGLGQEGGRAAHACRYLAADELVELDLVSGGNYFTVAVINFELRGSDFGVVLLIFKAHRALYFGRGVDEGAQGVAGKGVVVAAGVYVLEPAGLVIAALGVDAFKEETFRFRWRH